jgi:hypothetical protein
MGTKTCDTCHQPLDVCPYGGDCGEMQAIYLAHHKEQMKDIDISELTEECMVCGCPIEPHFNMCYSCEKGFAHGR